MNKPASKLTLIAAILAIACTFAVTPVHAASNDSKADKKKKREEADLKKYDKNANGKLDPDEEAARKADQERKKGKKKKS